MNKYRIIEGGTAAEVENEVEKYLFGGWELHGPLIVIPIMKPSSMYNMWYSQVITLTEPSSDKPEVLNG